MTKAIYDPKNDPCYQNPRIDVDEWRTRCHPDGTCVPCRYMHGYFEGTAVKFSFFFPEKERYEGRFQQYLSPFPGPDEEVASIGRTGVNDRILFALCCGAYFVESNMGSAAMFGGAPDATLCWKSSAAVAEYSRVKAMEMYGCERPYGYIYGGSGGGYKTMACIENTRVWDGGVPYVIGSPVSLPNTITMHAQGQRVLRNAFSNILDALDAGGSGDPYAGLTKNEADMLRELTKMGFPPAAWYLEAWGEVDDGSLPVLTPVVKSADSEYFTEFWTVPGYMGADPDSSAAKDRLQFSAIVKSVRLPNAAGERSPEDGLNGVDDAWKKQLIEGNGAYIEVEALPAGNDLYLRGVDMTFQAGAAAGKVLRLGKMIRDPEGEGGCLTIGAIYGMDDLNTTLSAVKPGDKLLLDNSDYIAIQSYYRHQVPADLSFHAWDQFRDENGKPVLPQRNNVMGYGFTGVGGPQDGQIQCKVINIQALMDADTCPWCSDWYRKKIAEVNGSDHDHRNYYMERCMHGDVDARANYMVVNYMGALRQALIDLALWVEKDVEPLPRSGYTLGEDGQIHLTGDIDHRGGMQAEVTLTANGEKLAHVKPGETVTLAINARVPHDAGSITEILLCPQTVTGSLPAKDMWPVSLTPKPYEENGIHCARASCEVSYPEPGVYFAACRIASERNGNKDAVFTQVLNLDRVRIVVE